MASDWVIVLTVCLVVSIFANVAFALDAMHWKDAYNRRLEISDSWKKLATDATNNEARAADILDKWVGGQPVYRYTTKTTKWSTCDCDACETKKSESSRTEVPPVDTGRKTQEGA